MVPDGQCISPCRLICKTTNIFFGGLSIVTAPTKLTLIEKIYNICQVQSIKITRNYNLATYSHV